MTRHLFGLEGDGNVADHRLQRGNFGPGQENVSDSVGRWGTEEHETQLEVNPPPPPMRLHSLSMLTYLFSRYYLDDCKALVFMVDSSDPSRLPEAQKALKKVLSDEKLRSVPLMVLANKKDLPNSMTIREVPNCKSAARTRRSSSVRMLIF